jgi:hypothetical protein
LRRAASFFGVKLHSTPMPTPTPIPKTDQESQIVQSGVTGGDDISWF